MLRKKKLKILCLVMINVKIFSSLNMFIIYWDVFGERRKAFVLLEMQYKIKQYQIFGKN